MAKYQAYAEYKDSGVEFLPILPSTWKVRRVKSILDLQRTILGEKSKYYQLLSLTLRGVILRDVSGGDGKIPESFDTYQAVKKKDLVFCLFDMDETPRTVGISEHDGMITGAYNVYKVNKSSFPKFIYYYFLHLDYFKGLKPFYTGLRKVVRSDTFANIKMPCPPLAEQTQIANFLDHETAKIDHLIEKQQQLIELLKEKRQAVISHAVTKGLNPNVPMKDSGMKWLGEVPKHWSVSLIKYQCREITDGAHISPELENGEHLFISIRDIKEGVINFEDTLLTSEKSYQYLVHTGCKPFAGDILFSKDGTIGQTAITPSNINFVVASSLIIIRPNYFKVISEFLDLLLRSDVVQEQVESFVKGAALRRLSIQNLLKIWGVFPPIDEQEKIVEFVLFQLDKYKVLEDKAEKQVELLKERRTALISAAVTGKIDVRNWKAPRVAEANTELSA